MGIDNSLNFAITILIAKFIFDGLMNLSFAPIGTTKCINDCLFFCPAQALPAKFLLLATKRPKCPRTVCSVNPSLMLSRQHFCRIAIIPTRHEMFLRRSVKIDGHLAVGGTLALAGRKNVHLRWKPILAGKCSDFFGKHRSVTLRFASPKPEIRRISSVVNGKYVYPS